MFKAGFFSAMVIAVSLQGGDVFAQVGPGGAIDPGRDCQTIRTCNFKRGGAYRGCLSSYSCRTCKWVNAKCEIEGRGRTCRRLVCTWG